MKYKVGDTVINNCDCPSCRDSGSFGKLCTIKFCDGSSYKIEEYTGWWKESKFLPSNLPPKELFEL